MTRVTITLHLTDNDENVIEERLNYITNTDEPVRVDLCITNPILWNYNASRVLAERLKGIEVNSLKIIDEGFGQYHADDIDDLFDRLQDIQFADIDLSGQDLFAWDTIQIGRFFKRLQHKELTSINFSHNRLGKWNDDKVAAFVNGLQLTSAKALNLGWNEIHRWRAMQIDAFDIRNTQINCLSLEGNGLCIWLEWPGRIWDFVRRLKHSQITKLNLDDNDLEFEEKETDQECISSITFTPS